MKIERHLCDLCGGAIGKAEGYAVLSVPDFDGNEKKAAKPDQPTIDGYIVLSWVGCGSERDSSKKYDVCRGCCEGLMKARACVRRAALERMFAHEEEQA